MKHPKNMFMAVLWCSIFMLLLGTFTLTAQQATAPHALAFRANAINHAFPNNQQFLAPHTFAGEIAYQKYLSPHFDLAVPLRIGMADYFETKEENTIEKNSTFLSADALLHTKFHSSPTRFAPYLLAGIGVNFEDFEEASAQVPLGLGLDIRLQKQLSLNIQTEYRLGFKKLRDNWTHSIGLVWSFGEGQGNISTPNKPADDRDADGIADSKDRCPDIAGLPQFKGCPDTDKDGIPDPKDQCPLTAGAKDNAGCPYHQNDKDHDGVLDAEDRCPNTVGLARFQGCPDSDGDGISDIDDPCPSVFGLVRYNGCPDTDGDSVPDPDDRCPMEAGPATNYGCPELDVADKEVLLAAMQAVEFETSLAILKETSFPVLDEIVGVLQKHPAYQLRIIGHTDSVGDASSNQLLSEKRAKSCYDYLRQKGIATNRMEYLGLGETKPIADNNTMEGRQKNRRVEFEVYIK